MGFFGGGNAGNDEFGNARTQQSAAEQNTGQLDQYGNINYGVYDQYAPQQLDAQRRNLQYDTDRSNYGLTGYEQNQLMGGYAGGTQAAYDQANSAVDLNNQRRGITPDSSTAQGAYGNNANNALNAYMQAKAAVGAANLNARAQGRQNVLTDYSSIVDPAAQRFTSAEGAAYGQHSQSGQMDFNQGMQERQYGDTHSPWSTVSSLLNTGAKIYGLARGGGGGGDATPAQQGSPYGGYGSPQGFMGSYQSPPPYGGYGNTNPLLTNPDGTSMLQKNDGFRGSYDLSSSNY